MGLKPNGWRVDCEHWRSALDGAFSALKMHFYFQLSLLASLNEAATRRILSAKYPISSHYPKARAVVFRKHINPAQQEPVSKVADTTF